MIDGREPLDGAWWKLLLAAPCLIVLVIAGSGLGVEAWFLAMLLVLLAVLCSVAGVLLGAVAFVRHRRVAQG